MPPVETPSPRAGAPAASIDAATLRRLALDAGAADVGLVEIERAEIAAERPFVERALPGTRTLVSIVMRMNREPIRSPARSAANLEFHRAGEDVNEVARRVVRALEDRGIRALNPSMGFPMEMDGFPGRLWVVSHKTVAAAAGLGAMGIHRSVIHPKFGSFVLLGTVLVAAEVERHDRPIDWNPCLACKLCVAACPVGALKKDGAFDFAACYTHNYREFMGGFTDWVESVADARNAAGYRHRVSDAESASVWQSLSYGANYKAAYCIAVCPAGEDVRPPFDADRSRFVADVVKPLQQKEEPVYVVRGSDAEAHVAKRYPHKTVRRVGNSLRPSTIGGFVDGLPLVFQRERAADVDATYHFTFTGPEARRVTVVVARGTLEVKDELHGKADLAVVADGATWIRFLRKDAALLPALLRRRIRIRGNPLRLRAFARCFLGG